MSAQWGPVIGAASVPAEPAVKARRKPFFKRKQFLVAGVVLAVILGYLIYIGVRNAGMYYMSVSELMAQQTTLGSQSVRVQGKVLSDSVQQDPSSNTIRFRISDGQTSLPVVYTGVVPDSFKPDADVVLEGALTPAGTFQATNVMAKCASKYSPG